MRLRRVRVEGSRSKKETRVKLVRHGPKGGERLRILYSEGSIRDLSKMCDDFGPAFMRLGVEGLGIQGQRVVRWEDL